MGNKTTTAVFESIKKGGDCLGRCIARGLGCERVPDCDVTRCPECIDGWWGIVADTIEHEKAEAVSAVMDGHLREWAEDNGLPASKDGEDFKTWLNRCFLQRPLFEDGEPVQIGDKVLNYDRERTVDNIAVAVYGTECLLLAFVDSPEKRLKRPAPEVLGADGQPIKAGDTVYDIESGDRYTVKIPYAGTGKTFFDDGHYSDPAYLTHTPPDAQWRIDKDVPKSYQNYWGCEELPCGACPAIVGGRKPWQRYGVYNCDDARMLDLLRRQRELDARMGGE